MVENTSELSSGYGQVGRKQRWEWLGQVHPPVRPYQKEGCVGEAVMTAGTQTADPSTTLASEQ